MKFPRCLHKKKTTDAYDAGAVTSRLQVGHNRLVLVSQSSLLLALRTHTFHLDGIYGRRAKLVLGLCHC